MPQNQKILLITFEYPPERGGIATYLGNIYSRPLKEELRVLVPKTGIWQIILFQTFFIFFRERFSEIHLSHVLPIGYIALVFKKLFNIPYVVYTHGMDVLLPQQSVWKKFWLKTILKNAAGVIANSEFTKNEIVKLGIKRNIEVKYPCIRPLNPFSYSRERVNEIKRRYHLEGKKIILSVGRLVARKGFDKVIEALPQVLEQIPEAVYVVIGDGPMRSNLDALCSPPLSIESGGRKKEVRPRLPVIFVSGVSDEDLGAWYDLCDIFTMPARRIGPDVEGFGIVFLEAGLCGKPSVGGRSGGIPEAIEDGKTGILVDPENTKEIADALIRLLKDDNLRKQLGEAAKKRVIERFICD